MTLRSLVFTFFTVVPFAAHASIPKITLGDWHCDAPEYREDYSGHKIDLVDGSARYSRRKSYSPPVWFGGPFERCRAMGVFKPADTNQYYGANFNAYEGSTHFICGNDASFESRSRGEKIWGLTTNLFYSPSTRALTGVITFHELSRKGIQAQGFTCQQGIRPVISKPMN